VELAESLLPEHEPALFFELGQLYATAAEGLYSASKQRAARRLMTFSNRVCRGAADARPYWKECQAAAVLLQRLGDVDSSAPLALAPPSTTNVTPVSVPAGMPIPELELRKVHEGDAFTVWGASSYLRSRNHSSEVTAQPIAITGYIVKTNLMEAPRCALHRGGIADPLDCYPPLPAFWICDEPNATLSECIKVMGFASNYAEVLEAMRVADSKRAAEPYRDTFSGQLIPNPLPVAGAKWTVHGSYGVSFDMAATGPEFDPIMGILGYAHRDMHDAGPTLATLPGIKRRER
jgi:hypothetical protein